MTLAELRAVLRLELSDETSVRSVLETITGESYEAVARKPATELSLDQSARAAAIVEQIHAGVPLQHAIGHWSFRHLELLVDERALIPRPETELLVDMVLLELTRIRSFATSPLRCLELGTGTGAIALSVLFECPDVIVVATDVSVEALELAAANADAVLGQSGDRLEFLRGSWYEALDKPAPSNERFDVICSNPPYLSALEWCEADPIVRDHDPKIALVSGDDGLDALREIAAGAQDFLHPDGALVLEIGWAQGEEAKGIVTAAGARSVEVVRDLVGRDRFILARF